MGNDGIGRPRGVWYEKTRKRYRVRLYRNHKTYHAGYFDEEASAMKALAALKTKLASIPKRKRNQKVKGRVPRADSASDMLRAATESTPE